MLIKMLDGGILNYADDNYHYDGCPTCNFGSEYINEVDITLTHYAIHFKTNQMYEYVLSEGQMMKLFLSEYNTIQAMTESEFVDWFKVKLSEITEDDFNETFCGRIVEEFTVKELTNDY